jgi:predicted nuclease with RNAse H fold
MGKEKWQIAGIDYGSKMAGTTVIASLKNLHIQISSSEKKKDADAFILQWAQSFSPQYVFLDAPLSLPGVYTNLPGCEDYFYRQADKQLKAMSPMFLGGLTARAMKLRSQLVSGQVQVREVYPSQMAKVLTLKDQGYKKQKERIQPLLKHLAPFLEDFHWQPEMVTSWHHFDALLALVSGLRFMEQEHETYGMEGEGVIVI